MVDEDVSNNDLVYWSASSHGNFSVSSVYELSIGAVNDDGDKIWGMVWKLKVLDKIWSFLWLVVHKRVMCNEERLRKGFVLEGSCKDAGFTGEC